MSRVGKQIIKIPQGVSTILANGTIMVKGPKGELTREINPLVTVAIQNDEITLTVQDEEEKKQKSLWGTYAAHIKNMILGVSQGFKRQLEINGVGYRVAKQGNDLKIEVGFSHPVIFQMPKGITSEVEKNIITITGFDKELVGSTAAEIRNVKKPEPYKGKGIKYVEETIRRKAGKTAAKGA